MTEPDTTIEAPKTVYTNAPLRRKSRGGYVKHTTTCSQCGSSITIFERQDGGGMNIVSRWLDRRRVRKGVNATYKR